MIGVASAASALGLFSFMTIFRTKFEGLSLEGLDDFHFDDLMYGFFAEANIVFGWVSAKSLFGTRIEFVGIDPFLEIVTQLVPRFLNEGKSLYQHLNAVNLALAGSQESLQSGTAMPFFGEYYASFGWIGVVVGTIGYSLFSRYLLYRILSIARSYREYMIGGCLFVVFMAYYYYSRGSIAQISKGFLFIILPYLYLMKRSHPRRSHQLGPDLVP